MPPGPQKEEVGGEGRAGQGRAARGGAGQRGVGQGTAQGRGEGGKGVFEVIHVEANVYH